MPSGKKLRSAKSEPETSASEIAEPTTSSAEESSEDVAATEEAPAEEVAPEEAPATKKPRRKFFGRRQTQPAEAAVPAEEKVDDATVEVETPTEDAPEEQEPADGEAAAEDPVLVPHQPAGKRLKIAAAAAAVLFVAGGAFVGATAQPVIANSALVETKLNIARTAANAITTLWSYTPENMDSLGERSAKYLSGDFAFQYKKFIDSIAATNKQAQVTNTTSVLGTAVESVNQSEASAIVYTNSIATSPVSKNIPSLRYLSYRLEMKRDRSDWRITRMTTITTLDLTPQL